MDTRIPTQVELLPHDAVDVLNARDIFFPSLHNPLTLQHCHAETNLFTFRGTFDPHWQQLFTQDCVTALGTTMTHLLTKYTPP